MKVLINNYIRQLKAIQEEKIWIGTNFQKKLNPIPGTFFFTRPLEDLHSIAEIISHLTTWRKEAIIKIRTGAGTITDEAEDNWFSNETLKKTGWTKVISNYEESLSGLIALIETKEDSFLKEYYYDPDFKGDFTYQFLLDGMVHHDLYHLGQLGIVIKLLLKK